MTQVMFLATNVGHHIVADLYFKDNAFLSSVQTLRPLIEKGIQGSELEIICKHFHQFEPRGATGVFLLSESHVAFHSWPEYNLLCVDVFTCSKQNKAAVFLEELVKKTKPLKVEKIRILRGKAVEQHLCASSTLQSNK